MSNPEDHKPASHETPKLSLSQLNSKWKEEHSAGELTAAIETLHEALRIAPDSIEIQTNLGRLLLEDNKAHKAIPVLEKALEANPQHVPALLELSKSYVKLQAPAKAYPPAQLAKQLSPQDAATHAVFASACHLKGDYPQSIEHCKTAIDITLRELDEKKKRKNYKGKPEEFNKEKTLELLWETLAQLAAAGIHAFPAFGTLLGIVRDGSLLPFDKDLDIALPFSEMQRACICMKRNGWQEVGNSFGMVNPRAFVHKEQGISMDLMGFIIRSESKLPSTGFWRTDIPKEWNWFADFSTIDLIKRETPLGEKAWFLADPELWLSELYGEWQVPDKNFDTLVAAKNLTSFSMVAQSYAYSRILNSLTAGNLDKALALTKHTLRHASNDPLLLRTRNKVQNQLGKN